MADSPYFALAVTLARSTHRKRGMVDITPAQLDVALEHVLDKVCPRSSDLLAVPGVKDLVAGHFADELIEYLTDDCDEPFNTEEN